MTMTDRMPSAPADGKNRGTAADSAPARSPELERMVRQAEAASRPPQAPPSGRPTSQPAPRARYGLD